MVIQSKREHHLEILIEVALNVSCRLVGKFQFSSNLCNFGRKLIIYYFGDVFLSEYSTMKNKCPLELEKTVHQILNVEKYDEYYLLFLNRNNYEGIKNI